MVTPECPPTTGTSISVGCLPFRAATKVLARITSSVETPNSRFLSYTPAFFSTSAAIATVVFTGLVMTPISAFGAVVATCSIRLRTIPALTLNRSARSMPGLRATPAEISTTSAPCRAGVASSPLNPSTFTAVGIWLRSTATPGVTGAMSYSERAEPAGNWVLSSRASAWPIPPAAPRTATFILNSLLRWGRDMPEIHQVTSLINFSGDSDTPVAQ